MRTALLAFRAPASRVLVAALSMALLASLAVSASAATSLDDAVSTTVEDPYYPSHGDPGVDALKYDLDLKWSPGHRTLSGLATIRLRSTSAQSSLTLDLSHSLSVRSVSLDGVSRAFSRPGNDLVISSGPVTADSRHTAVVVYRGTPRRAAAPTKREDIPALGWTTKRDGGMWTMQEPFGAFTWYPVNDHPSDKAFYDIRVDVPDEFVGVSNGRLVSRRHVGSRTLTHWRMSDPAASYLVTLAIGDDVQIKDRGPHDLPISYWVPRNNRDSLRYLRKTPQLIRWLEQHLGPYPFDRIGAVVVPSTSAMETQELITMGTGRLKGRQDALSVLLHEYSHQWYGDTVTPNNWPDLWLNESFAMYVQMEWEVDQGWSTEHQYRQWLRSIDDYARSDGGPPGAYHPNNFGGMCVYTCGALMLLKLRDRLGTKTFNSALRAWPQQHLNSNVNRADYIDWINTRTGRDLSPFLTLWLTSPTTP